MIVRSDSLRLRRMPPRLEDQPQEPSPWQVYNSDRMHFGKRSIRWLLYLQPAAEASGPAAR